MQRWAELKGDTPLWEDVVEAFDCEKEARYVEQLTLKRQAARATKH